jgi:hypothetical protein
MEANQLKRREFIALFTGAAAWSSVADAQSARKRFIGMIVQGTPTQRKGLRFGQAFFDGLRELGYVEGRDFDIATRSTELTSDLPKAAQQLVQLKSRCHFCRGGRECTRRQAGNVSDSHRCRSVGKPGRAWTVIKRFPSTNWQHYRYHAVCAGAACEAA